MYEMWGVIVLLLGVVATPANHVHFLCNLQKEDVFFKCLAAAGELTLQIL